MERPGSNPGPFQFVGAAASDTAVIDEKFIFSGHLSKLDQGARFGDA
jgi:hypothetical protein